LKMNPTAAAQALHARPALVSAADPAARFRSTWTLPDQGVTLTVEASGVDPNSGAPILPYQVIAIELTSVSRLRTGAGIGLGSTAKAVDAAYGAHVVARASTATTRFVGNADDARDGGLVFHFVDGKVAKIRLGASE
jgi:hypothetical protein